MILADGCDEAGDDDGVENSRVVACCAGVGFTVTLVRRAIHASLITMPVVEFANFSATVVFTSFPCSSCVQSVSRNRSLLSRPMSAEGRCEPSIVQERPEAKKSWSVGKKVLRVQ